jgi:hypothetical protein
MPPGPPYTAFVPLPPFAAFRPYTAFSLFIEHPTLRRLFTLLRLPTAFLSQSYRPFPDVARREFEFPRCPLLTV